jgi:hypothetical protein
MEYGNWYDKIPYKRRSFRYYQSLFSVFVFGFVLMACIDLLLRLKDTVCG